MALAGHCAGCRLSAGAIYLSIAYTSNSSGYMGRAAIYSACNFITIFVTKYHTLLYVADVCTHLTPPPCPQRAIPPSPSVRTSFVDDPICSAPCAVPMRSTSLITGHSTKMKKRSERRKHCALAVAKNFRPVADPLPVGVARPKFNQLEMVTTFTYRPSLVKIDIRNFELSW